MKVCQLYAVIGDPILHSRSPLLFSGAFRRLRLRAAYTRLASDSAGEALVKLIEVLDDHDDVQRVTGNYELSDALMAKLSG